MIRLSLRDLWSRKLRTVLTMLAIVLGVAMIAGTYVITDQINNGFHDIFEKAAVGTDVNITHKAAFSGQDLFATGGSLPAPLLDQVRAVNGVADAAGSVDGSGAVVVNGKSVTHRRRAHARLLDGAAALQPEQVHRRRARRRATARWRSTPSWPPTSI